MDTKSFVYAILYSKEVETCLETLFLLPIVSKTLRTFNLAVEYQFTRSFVRTGEYSAVMTKLVPLIGNKAVTAPTEKAPDVVSAMHTAFRSVIDTLVIVGSQKIFLQVCARSTISSVQNTFVIVRVIVRH